MSGIRVRDPVHGTIEVSAIERAALDHPLVARLRGVKQLGFVEHVFPGATHSRYAHALGAMHVASALFDAAFGETGIGDSERRRMRAALRLAALLHDLGHPPFSHALEPLIPEIAGEKQGHEGLTRLLFRESDLSGIVAARGVDPADVTSIWTGESRFCVDGIEYTPFLRSIVAGELDCDRMDYLLRDAHHAGVSYGRYDYEWLRSNVTIGVANDVARLAIAKRAVYAFEDFLLSRLQMFLAVYFHPTAVAFDEMLRRHFESGCARFALPVEPTAFASCDDAALITALRRSDEPWARRVVERRPFRLLHETDAEFELSAAISRTLVEAAVPSFSTESRGVVSRYFGGEPPLVVADGNRVIPIAEATPVYEYHREHIQISRVYVAPEDFERAQSVKALTLRQR